ncbi:hypothetical protein WDV93_22895 [Pantoea ananatis]
MLHRLRGEWVNGETFLYLGRGYRLQLVAGQKDDLKLKDGRFCLQREIVPQGGDIAAAGRSYLFTS